MRLSDYVRTKGRGTIKRIADASGVSYQTVRLAAAGMLVKQYEVAKAISDATEGAVSIDDLCTAPSGAEEEAVAPDAPPAAPTAPPAPTGTDC